VGLHEEGLAGEGIGEGKEREGREERVAHHGLDGRQQPLTGIQPRAEREVERGRGRLLRGKERIRGRGHA
jgi:hypothetical protein